MRHIVLSGISPYVLRDLEHNKVKTIEIRSPHNFLSTLEINVGDVIFITATSLRDIGPGTIGTLAKVRERQISMHRLIHKTDVAYEEAEVQMARLQLEMKGHARVRRTECCQLGEAAIVDADEVLFFEGR